MRESGSPRVERPPLLREADTAGGPSGRLLGELLVLGPRRGDRPADPTRSAADVAVGPGAAGDHPPAGESVAVAVRGPGGWGPDARWWPGAAPAEGLPVAPAGRPVPEMGAVAGLVVVAVPLDSQAVPGGRRWP